MQGQSSPVQVKDPNTGSILMHVGSSCKHTCVQCTPPRNYQKLIDGSNKKTNKNKTINLSFESWSRSRSGTKRLADAAAKPIYSL